MSSSSAIKENPVERLTDLTERATLWLARASAVGLALMTVLTFFDVIGRYFFNSPIVGTVEVTELLMGLIVYLGIGYTTITHGHIRVDIVITHLPSRLQAVLDVITLAISIIFAVLIFWRLWLKAEDTVATGDMTQLWEIPIAPVAYVMAVCSIPLVLGLLLQFIQALHSAIRGETTS
jgi:TRAP-type C4-dicarboxylate transport system permease small subunit